MCRRSSRLEACASSPHNQCASRTSRHSGDKTKGGLPTKEARLLSAELSGQVSYEPSAISKDHLEGPLHRPRPTSAEHWVAAVGVRRRSDLAERTAANTRAQEPTEIHAIGQVEDFPARLDPRSARQLELLDEIHVELRERRQASRALPAGAKSSGGGRRERLCRVGNRGPR